MVDPDAQFCVIHQCYPPCFACIAPVLVQKVFESHKDHLTSDYIFFMLPLDENEN